MFTNKCFFTILCMFICSYFAPSCMLYVISFFFPKPLNKFLLSLKSSRFMNLYSNSNYLLRMLVFENIRIQIRV